MKSPVQAVRAAYASLSTTTRERLLAIIGLAFSAIILAAVFWQLDGLDFTVLTQTPTNPLFWLCFVATYVLSPFMDWLILRRIWGLGAAAFPALLRKQAANEVVLGYSGDAQLYVWARRTLGPEGRPFETLRDVAVTSALAGNLVTLAMLVLNAPIVQGLAQGTLFTTLLISTATIVLSSLAIFLFRRFVFALPPRQLAVTIGIHTARILLSLVLTALLWKLLLPSISVAALFLVGTLRMMMSRLPFVPAREALLAPLIVALLGDSAGLAGAVLFVATLMLATHVVVGGVSALADFVARPRARLA
ncbi:hypothetical protein SAMN03159338_3726 [Sphingomonas sp. NFR04]|uniref:hypothetical protein n=1 Tax=Sphingomonas sp. NFR04 TaxID=1566283 RepID=UPI0008E12FDD|nr:hypothetical protein [Sphingomonas sp. NFR04]SFK25892.1 hypothetical protein SAMN03159338_3726 [Sphingomonas sp. NFR04]